MLGKPIINPVAKKVIEIIEANEARNCVPHRVFNCVRNREVLLKTLEREGFAPDDQINPKLWIRVPKPSKHVPERTASNTSMRQKVADTLIEQGEVYRGEIEVNKQYLISTVSQLRKEGHEIVPIKSGRRLLGYKLVA